MLRSVKEILGYRIDAKDGEIGKVRDLLFDDHLWLTRYLVVDTGTWLPGREVLVSPISIGRPDWGARSVPVSLTKTQIEQSPPVSSDRPVSRQDEQQLAGFFDWPMYWYPPMTPPGFIPILPDGGENGENCDTDTGQKTESAEDPHLRSFREVKGYHIHAEDGQIGHVDDFIDDQMPDGWLIRYMVIDTRNWLPGKKVLLSPHWALQVSWADREIRVATTREFIKEGPKFDPSSPVNREYEARLYDHYGKPRYWEEHRPKSPANSGSRSARE